MSLYQMTLNEIIGKPVLYHFTRIDNMFKIIDSNMLRPFEDDKVYFTRNFNASITGKAQLYIRFAIDRQKLVDYYKVSPSLYDPDRGLNNNDLNSRRLHFHKLDTFNQNKVRHNRVSFGEEREENVKAYIKDLHKFVIQIDIIAKRDFKETWLERIFGMTHEDIEYHFNDKTRMDFINDKEEFREYIKETYPIYKELESPTDDWRLDTIIEYRNKFNEMIKSHEYNNYKGKFNIVDKWRPVKV